MGKYVRQQKYMWAVMKNRKSVNSGHESSVHKTIKCIQDHRLNVFCLLLSTCSLLMQFLHNGYTHLYFAGNIFECTVITNGIIFSRIIASYLLTFLQPLNLYTVTIMIEFIPFHLIDNE